MRFLHEAREPLVDALPDGAGAGVGAGDDPNDGIGSDDVERHRQRCARTSPPVSSSGLTAGKPASSGVSLTKIAMPIATTVAMPAGIQKSQRQCSGGICHSPRKTNPASSAGPSLKIPKRPRLIMNPKMPAKPPRSCGRNQAALIFTMPGAPNACMYPSMPRMATKSPEQSPERRDAEKRRS